MSREELKGLVKPVARLLVMLMELPDRPSNPFLGTQSDTTALFSSPSTERL